MLPILRLASVGGVLLAITILGLALIPPSRPHMQWAVADAPARGALIDRQAHPEWRQFLILSALRRAGELDRLRGLPETQNDASGEIAAKLQDDAAKAKAESGAKFAGLPLVRDDAEPDDATASINVAPSATMPIDIGETSSFELPVGPVEEKPPIARSPAIGMIDSGVGESTTPAIAAPEQPIPPASSVAALPPPEQTKPVVVIHKRSVRKGPARPAAAEATETNVSLPPPFNLFQAIFASLSGGQSAAAEPQTKPAIARRPAVRRSRTANIR